MGQPSHVAGGEGRRERLVVGWFSFTCCEDSTILLTEMLNDHLEEWLRVVEFRHMKSLKTINSLEGLDVAFVEGAISSDSQAAEVRKIRESAEHVVAVGACACTGKPSTSRNQFEDEQIDYGVNVVPLDEVIRVDDMVRGCPMKAQAFLQTLEKYLKLYEVA